VEKQVLHKEGLSGLSKMDRGEEREKKKYFKPKKGGPKRCQKKRK
jgi:hypothetical protein